MLFLPRRARNLEGILEFHGHATHHVEQLFSQLSDEQKAIELASMKWSRISPGRIATRRNGPGLPANCCDEGTTGRWRG